jgi:3-oxoacyl-[acyl-carrier-protein] synthase II
MTTPVGVTTAASWQALLEGRSGIAPVPELSLPKHQLPVTIGGIVRDFDPEPWMPEKKVAGRCDRFAQLALCAALQAWTDASLPQRLDDDAGARAGTIIGVGFGGILRLLSEYEALSSPRGAGAVSAFGVPAVIGNMAPALVAIRHNLRGANWAPASACASGSHAIGEGFLSVRNGRHDLCVAGGAEAAVCPLTVAAFAKARAVCRQYQDTPERASRPFERNREGFVIAEGAGMVVLEELEHARRRGAVILGELVGYGTSCDSIHVTLPSADGEGAARAIRAALSMGQIDPSTVLGVSAHGTSTRSNDVTETRAIKEVFGSHARSMMISAPKSMLGHSLGAAGALQSVIALLTLRDRLITPTINYEEPDPECDLDYVPNRAREFAGDAMMVNAFGFGGTNAVLVFRRAG